MADRSDDIKQLFSHLGLNPGTYREIREPTRAEGRGDERSTRKPVVPSTAPAPVQAKEVQPTPPTAPPVTRKPASPEAPATRNGPSRWSLLGPSPDKATAAPAPAPVPEPAPAVGPPPVTQAASAVRVAPAVPPPVAPRPAPVAPTLSVPPPAPPSAPIPPVVVAPVPPVVVAPLPPVVEPLPTTIPEARAEPLPPPVVAAPRPAPAAPAIDPAQLVKLVREVVAQEIAAAPTLAARPTAAVAAPGAGQQNLADIFQRLIEADRPVPQRSARLQFNYASDDLLPPLKNSREEKLEDLFSRLSSPSRNG